jgi:hypothetical protein
VLVVGLTAILKGSSSFGLVSSSCSCFSPHHYVFFCNLVSGSCWIVSVMCVYFPVVFVPFKLACKPYVFFYWIRFYPRLADGY